MLEFTISMTDANLEFKPFQEEPDLKFMLAPTARIGEKDDNVHLAPIPVHSFFNAVVFSNWLATTNEISVGDAFAVYLLHDMFKSLLRLRPKGHRKTWLHGGQQEFFDYVKADIRAAKLFDQFSDGYKITARHHYYHKKLGKFEEAADYEDELKAEQFQAIGLAIRLQPALSNVFAITHLKDLFVEAYVEALRAEYPTVFAKLEEITYCYEFVGSGDLTGDVKKDMANLCQRSRVTLVDNKLRIQTFIGAVSALLPGEHTSIRLPFWMLLVLREDPTSIVFPVPELPGKPLNAPFVNEVKQSFYHKVETLLRTVPSRGKHWDTKLTEILAHLQDTVHIASGDFAQVSRSGGAASQDAVCALCSSPIPKSFLCLPHTDLGVGAGRYTDWHIGDASSTCLLCAISNFPTFKPGSPSPLARAKKLVKQRQLVYFSVTTPHASVAENLLDSIPKADLLPFFTAPIDPTLVISSLESLVTLNLIGALFLHSAIRASEVSRDGERELWLEPTVRSNPFSFVGQVGKTRSKRALPEFLQQLQKTLNRAVFVIDPMLMIQVEVPFHTLVCVVGAKSGRHYELKFKPLLVSNEMGTLPIVHDGYHFIDKAAVDAVTRVQQLLRRFRARQVTDRMKVTAIATDPREFIAMLVELGGFNYETVHQRLTELAGGGDSHTYLEDLRTTMLQYPIITELWR
jgi:hypothetical protein